MGSRNLQKRLTSLKKQLESDHHGRIGFFRAFFVSLVVLWILASVLPASEIYRTRAERHISSRDAVGSARLSQSLRETRTPHLPWEIQRARERMREEVANRVAWLKKIPFRAGAAQAYASYSHRIIEETLPRTGENNEGTDALFDLRSWKNDFFIYLTDVFLRLGFITFGFWPLWVTAAVIGVFGLPRFFQPRKADDILGICDRGVGPFYSGIYGPLRQNNKMSGTDLSVPGLACPAAVSPSVAASHRLTALLKRYSADSETTRRLVGIILAYRDYPSFVEEERNSEDSGDNRSSVRGAGPSGKLTRVENETVEKTAVEGLGAVLAAHQALMSFSAAEARKKEVRLGGGNADRISADFYQRYVNDLGATAKSSSPLTKLLLASLTSARSRELSALSPSLVATAYLAIEAGKSLVFKRVEGGGFVQISRFPHLQARAVLHSLPCYHREFDGDARLIARQAIITSRRHGDFGRPFLPIEMPIASRALRDWLEILSAATEHRQKVAHLVELDAHLEEIHFNFRTKLLGRLKAEREQCEKEGARLRPYPLWKGLPFKSVVLVPLGNIADIALSGLSESRLARIWELIHATRQLQSSMSISARLPGFKRQALEAEQTTLVSHGLNAIFQTSESGRALLERWFILRRVLTRYNWLSTRVGDCNVPVDGLVHAVVVDRSLTDIDHNSYPEVVGLDTLVPLRQRRFREIAGPSWERMFYDDAPHPNDLQVFVDHKEFTEAFLRKVKEAQMGLLASPPLTGATSTGSA